MVKLCWKMDMVVEGKCVLAVLAENRNVAVIHHCNWRREMNMWLPIRLLCIHTAHSYEISAAQSGQKGKEVPLKSLIHFYMSKCSSGSKLSGNGVC